MSQSTIVSIIEKYSAGTLSVEEERVLYDWLEAVAPQEFHETLDRCSALPEGLRRHPAISSRFVRELECALDGADADHADVAGDEGGDWRGAAAEEPIGHELVVVRRVWWRWVAAAAVFVLALGGWFLVANRRPEARPAAVVSDIAPGTSGAVLTLGDGKQIVLDSAGVGFSTKQGGATIRKGGADRLVYDAKGDAAAVLYNTLSTPRGRKISVVLADGTKVWLNAFSSVRYPTAFAGPERIVEVTGEAYFEVAANAGKPFMVRKMGSDYMIQVLGTKFNINAYEDEGAIRTTLMEGAVRIKNKNVPGLTLKPGEQAIVAGGQDGIALATGVNTSEVLAWKDGLFNFDRADIHTVMRQIARWYDVDIEYKGEISRHFGGAMSQDVNISQVLKMLELTGAVRFSIEGRKVVVMP